MGRRVFSRNFFLFSWITFSIGLPGAFAGPTAAEQKALQVQAEWSTLLLNIEEKVQRLKVQLASAGIEYDTSDLDRLWNKIGPQAKLQHRPLIMMLLGQHNSGKSTFLNMMVGLAGNQRVTQVSDTGGSTTIPVALIPESFPEKDLPLLFGGFEVKRLYRATDATKAVPEGRVQMLWTKHALVPPSIAIVDTPDVDSYHRENSKQTQAMIDVADIVGVMITDQYANRDVVDALKQVAASKKPVILIFNKVNLKHHTKLWPKRLAELRKLTGIDVIDAFVIEDNPEAAERGDVLDFHRIGANGSNAAEMRPPVEAVHDLNVTSIRIQTELGALEELLDADTGLEAFVKNVEETNQSLATLSALLAETSKKAPTIVEWPRMPGGAIGQAILETWGKHHRGWVTTGIRSIPYWVRKGIGGVMRARYHQQIEEQERQYRQSEFEFLRDNVVMLVLRELQQLKDSGKVRGPLAKIVEAKTTALAVSAMQSKLQQAHERTKLVDAELTTAIKVELTRLKEENPGVYNFLQNSDTVLSAVELMAPVGIGLSASYFLSAPLLSNFATSLVAAPIQAGAGAAAWSGTTPATTAAGDKARNFFLRKPFENIVRQYANHRIAWVMEWMRDNYLADFYAELKNASEATGSVEVGGLTNAIQCARGLAQRIIEMGIGGTTTAKK